MYNLLENELKNILVDMDGVIADFQKLAEEIAGCTIEELEQKGLWQGFKEELCNSNFFFELEQMPLVEVLKQHIGKWEILSAVGNYNSEGVVELKKLWIEKVFGKDQNIKFNYVIKTKAKAQYACPNTLLIDDRTKSVNPFLDNGGQAILFNNSQEQIDLIERILMNC